jgi:DNA-binding MarR family transcriptional regulator
MGSASISEAVQDFMGSVSIVSSAVADWTERELQALEAPLTLGQLRLLKLLALSDGQSVRDVAAVMGVSSAAASKGVDRLVRRGFVERSEDEADRRAIRVAPTETGRRLLAEHERSKNRKLAELFEPYSADELVAAAAVLDRISVELIARSTDPAETCLRCGVYFRERCLLRKLAGRRCLYHRQKSGARGTSERGEGPRWPLQESE